MFQQIFLFTLLALSTAVPSCPPGFAIDTTAGKCYRVVKANLDWFQANQFCGFYAPSTYEGSLATVADFDDITFIDAFLSSDTDLYNQDIWLGAAEIDARQGWIWPIQQRSLDQGYSNWATGYPANNGGHCAYMRALGNPPRQWVNEGCDDSRYFLCELFLDEPAKMPKKVIA